MHMCLLTYGFWGIVDANATPFLLKKFYLTNAQTSVNRIQYCGKLMWQVSGVMWYSVYDV